MFTDILIQSGLNTNEAEIYQYLLQSGESAALDIAKNTPLKKGVVYVALNDLIAKGLVRQKSLPPKNPNVRNMKKIAYFYPEHPEKLRSYLENKEKEVAKAKNSLEANFSDIISSFNLVSGKPGVRFYEGMEGVRKVINDSLTAGGTIRSFANAKLIVENIDAINQEYVKKRDELGIKKKIILLDDPFTLDYMKNYHPNSTDTRFIDHDLFPFSPVMQIYDGKISYITFSEASNIGVLIEDKSIYEMHKSLFDFIWSQIKPTTS